MRAFHLPASLRTGSEEQAAVKRVYQQAGAVVYSTSDPRTRRADSGISDLLVFFPNRLVLLAHETKAGTGRLTPEQILFGAKMADGYRTDFAWGDAAAAIQYLSRGRHP